MPATPYVPFYTYFRHFESRLIDPRETLWHIMSIDNTNVLMDILLAVYVAIHGDSEELPELDVVEDTLTTEQHVYALLVLVEDCLEYWNQDERKKAYIETWIARHLMTEATFEVRQLFVKAWKEPFVYGDDGSPQFRPTQYMLSQEWRDKACISEANIVELNHNINHFSARPDWSLLSTVNPSRNRYEERFRE